MKGLKSVAAKTEPKEGISFDSQARLDRRTQRRQISMRLLDEGSCVPEEHKPEDTDRLQVRPDSMFIERKQDCQVVRRLVHFHNNREGSASATTTAAD